MSHDPAELGMQLTTFFIFFADSFYSLMFWTSFIIFFITKVTGGKKSWIKKLTKVSNFIRAALERDHITISVDQKDINRRQTCFCVQCVCSNF